MKVLFQQILIAIVALIVFSYSTAIGLSFIHNPNPQQIEIIQALIKAGTDGSQAFFQLVNGDNLKALVHNILH
jgi:SNF family Na+-dependent transporter